MNIKKFFSSTDLEDSFIVGYYGGTNLGDELLLEVIQLLLKTNDVKKSSLYYTSPDIFPTYHKDYGYDVVNATNRPLLLKKMFFSRSVVMGGGGIWGTDFNKSVFLLSIILFITKLFFGTKVHLIGIGYYNSTSRLGHIGAWLAGRFADTIVTRDEESLKNFLKINKKTSIDKDISFQMKDLDLSLYKDDIPNIAKTFNDKKDYTLVTLRRFKSSLKNEYQDLVLEVIKNKPKQETHIMLFESKDIDPGNMTILKDLTKDNGNISVSDFDYNPVSFYMYLKDYTDSVTVISPQFHGQIIAHLSGKKFMPISYDNKNSELFRQLNIGQEFAIKDMSIDMIEEFIDN